GDIPQAVGVLQVASTEDRDRPLAEKLLFQWADCEQRRGAFEKARGLFLQGLERWPAGSLAHESPHAGCPAAMHATDLPPGAALLAGFERDLPGNRLRLRQDILKGRWLAAKNDLAASARAFRNVMEATEIESTSLQARYYLADVLNKQ